MLSGLDALHINIPERAGIIMIALAIDAILGGLLARLRSLRPEAWTARLTGGLDRRLNRERRSARARLIRGIWVIALIVALAATGGVLAQRVAEWLDVTGLANIVLLSLALGQRRLIAPIAKAARFLAIGLIGDARLALAPIMGRDTRPLDRHGLARAGIEACAERLAFGVVAPVLWFALFGLPGLFVQRAVDAADQLIGFHTSRHAAFGFATARLNDALNLPPALIAALLAVLATTFVPAGRPVAAAAALCRDPWQRPGRAALWPEAAFAGALGLTLGGPRHYGGENFFMPWVNARGRARAEAADMRRALYLFMASGLFLAAAAALLGMAATS